MMIQLSPQSRIFLATEPVDFRNYVELAVMQSLPCSGHVRTPYQNHINAQKAATNCA